LKEYDPDNKAKIVKGIAKDSIKEFKNATFVDYNVAYNILLNTLLNLDLSESLSEINNYIDRVFTKYNSMPQAMAVREKVKKIINKIEGDRAEDGTLKNKKWIEFYTDGEILVDLSGTADMRYMVPFDVRKNTTGTYYVANKRPTENQSEFIQRATKEINDAIALFKFVGKPTALQVEDLVYQYTL